MSSPEDRERHARRIKNRIAKDLRTSKYQLRIIEPYDKNKFRKVDLKQIDDEEEDET